MVTLHDRSLVLTSGQHRSETSLEEQILNATKVKGDKNQMQYFPQITDAQPLVVEREGITNSQTVLKPRYEEGQINATRLKLENIFFFSCFLTSPKSNL